MNDLNTLSSYLDKANSILVCLPDRPDQDVVAASLALYLSLQASGKQVVPISSAPPVVRDSHLVGLDKITAKFGGNNLVITVNLPEDAVDKVTSSVEAGHLNLVMIPKAGERPIQKSDLSFGHSGAAADLVIVIGAKTLADLDKLVQQEPELFVKEKLINLSNRAGEFGVVNLTDPRASNSELVTAILQELHLSLTPDIANNLMRGIEAATGHFASASMTADTFEALAILSRAGARPVPVSSSPSASANLSDQRADWLKPKIFKGGKPSVS